MGEMGVRAILGMALTGALVGCASSQTVPPPPSPTSSRAPITQEAPTETRVPSSTPEQGRLLTAYFDYDDSALRPDARSALRQNADLLRRRGNVTVELQGNCDERGTEEYNWALGKRRAEAAKRYLVDLGIPGGRLSTVSFGEENPAVQGSSEAAWAKNRRVDFIIR